MIYLKKILTLKSTDMLDYCFNNIIWNRVWLQIFLLNSLFVVLSLLSSLTNDSDSVQYKDIVTNCQIF